MFGLAELFQQIPKILLIAARLGGMFVASPIFSSRQVPVLLKAGFILLVAVILLPVVGGEISLEEAALPDYGLAVLRELFMGLILGFVVGIVFCIFYLAGQFMDVPMGFGMANVLDPQLGMQVPLMAQFQFVLASVLFFAVNGHHLLLRAVAQSFQIIPPGELFMVTRAAGLLQQQFGRMFILAFQISLPIMGAIFLTDLALGLVTRVVPQINVFIVGFPAKIAVGFVILVFLLPAYVGAIHLVFSEGGILAQSLQEILTALSPSQ